VEAVDSPALAFASRNSSKIASPKNRKRKLIAREVRLGSRREKIWPSLLFLDSFGLASPDEL
jgi:hypothetical protein